MNFFKTPALLKRFNRRLLWDKKDELTASPRVYLTFDDGPVPEVTPWVWDTLAQFDAQATFFCVGENVDRYPALYQETLRRHHAVGNHTYHHLNAWRTDAATYQQDIDRCAHTLQKHHPLLKKPSALFRPPYGKVRFRQIRQLTTHYTLVMWDILSGDYDANFSAETCWRKCVRYTQPGTIIIFHDSLKAKRNLTYVLPRYLEHFARAGYTFATL
ncbi:MAG: polysaccharide deacetylase family protein [Tunicatimonas sp.]